MRSWPSRTVRVPAVVAVVALAALGVPTAAQADHLPPPTSVTLAGDLQQELGCPGDWQPECAATYLADADSDGVWSATFPVPVGTWAYKVALDDSWDVNFGANGAQGGADIMLVVEEAGDVSFTYDHATHQVTAEGEGLAGPALTEARAHWLTEDLIAWDVTDPQATYTLHMSPDGLELGDDGVTGGVTQPLAWVADSLPPDLAQQWPHLAGYAVLRVPDEVTARIALEGALAVSAVADGAITAATGLQVPGVLDDLYAAEARDVDLGVSWGDGGVPTLRLWAPTARSVTLHLFGDPAAQPPGQTVSMSQNIETGIWSVVGTADWDRRYYLYEVEVYVPSTGQVERNVVTDPYAVSLAANSTKSQIVDLSDADLQPEGWAAVGTQAPPTPEEIDLYELHVRDFSISDETVPAEHRGTYLAFTHPDTDGMQHLRALEDAGLTTVHLLPTFDIASIEEIESEQEQPQIPDAAPDSSAQQEAVLDVAGEDGFNWGYDPWHFNAPEGSYATDPDGTRRILEYRQMVQGLNDVGLGVVNDVVYNHTAQSGQAEKSVLDRIVPGYYHRLLEGGSIATSTCCENTATEHAMMEKLMVDSVVLWATQYKVDGFRFDLMGHHSRDNMLAVRAALDALTPELDGVDGSQIYVYGEGWNFGEVADDARFVQATQANMAGTGIGTFSDRLRDAVRGGGPFDEDPRVQGFGSGLLTDPNGAPVNGDAAAQRQALLLAMDQIRVGLAGNLADYTFTSRTGETVTGAQVPYNGQPAGYTGDPQENILYVSAHDNETLYDSNAFKLPPGTSMADRVRMQQLALSTVALGQGVSFFHAGSDILRSKSLDRNSYDSGDWFNAVDWSLESNNFGVGLPPAPDNEDKWPFMQPLLADPALVPAPADIAASAARFRDLLAVADSSPLFSLTTAEQIQTKVRFHNTGPDQVPGVIAMHLDDTAGADVDPDLDGVVVVFNASDEPVSVPLDGLAGRALALSPVLVEGADDVVRATAWDASSGTVTVPARTTAVLVEEQTEEPAAGARRILDVPAVAPGTVHCFPVAGEHGVPADATGVVVNVTAVAPTGPGYAVVYPDRRGDGRTPMPATSTVNFEPGRDVANSTFVALPVNGDLCFATQGAAQVRLLIDLEYIVAADSGIVLTHPARILDTRPLGVGEIDGPVPARTLRTVQVAGVAGVPADAESVILNVTLAGVSSVGNLRVFPGGASVPNTSVVNYAPGVDKANATVVDLADDGTISLWSDTTAPVHVILDVLGHTVPGSDYIGITPTRVVDTRAGMQVGAITGPLTARQAYTVTMSTAAPAGATAVVLNVTAIGPTTVGNLRVYPGDGAPPSASAINYIPGRDIANLVVVPLPADGRVSFWSDQDGGTVELAVDVLGYVPGPDDASLAQHSLRAPVTDETFYFVMADRFANGDPTNDTGGLGDDPMVSGFDPTRTGFYQGGDLVGILDNLDYIEGLGTTSLWLTPSFKNKAVQPEDASAGYHGYWITDFTQIDPHLGTNAELAALVDAAHARGMKVYFDIITNHTADVIGYESGARQAYVSKDVEPYRTAAGEPFDDRDFAGTGTFPVLDPVTSFPYVPVLAPGEEDLKVPAWLNDTTLYHNRGDTTFAGEDAYYGDFFGLDDLFTEHPTVVDGMIDVYQTWIADFGIDGFRIDTMKHVNDEFWQRFGPEVLEFAHDQGKDEFFMFGEVFDTSRPFTSAYTTRNEMQAVLDFPFQAAARDFASRSTSAASMAAFFADDDWYTDADSNAYQLPTFLGNHDMGRIGWMIQSDNPDAGETEWVARDRLAHELMYLSRGNPVIYYGDEQGFTGSGGDQVARQTLFASQVPEYLDDDLLGTDATHAEDNFDPSHPLYATISTLADVTADHPALRDGAHQSRYASEGSGIYAFSRIDREAQHEYVVAVNNSEEAQTATIETWVPDGAFELVYGDATESVDSTATGDLTVTVPPLSAVVYRSAGTIPASSEAPDVVLAKPAPSDRARSRMHVTARVAGSSFYEVTFLAQVDGGEWQAVGTDDTAPYQVFHDVASLPIGTPVAYRAVVLDNAGHTSVSSVMNTAAPVPGLTITGPGEGALVSGSVTVQAWTDPSRTTQTVTIERSLDGTTWTPLATDSSLPVFTAVDDVSGLADGTQVRYRAVLTEGSTTVTSEVRTVTVGTVAQPTEVSIPGSLNTEMGCEADWDPACEQAQMTLDPEDGLWKLTVTLPAGDYEYKAALNRTWDVNYGAGGAFNGSNIALSLGEESAVTFIYDHSTHLVAVQVGD